MKEMERVGIRMGKSQGMSGLHQIRKDYQSVTLTYYNDFKARITHKKLSEVIAIDSLPLYSVVENPELIVEPYYNRKYFTEKVFL